MFQATRPNSLAAGLRQKREFVVKPHVCTAELLVECFLSREQGRVLRDQTPTRRNTESNLNEHEQKVDLDLGTVYCHFLQKRESYKAMICRNPLLVLTLCSGIRVCQGVMVSLGYAQPKDVEAAYELLEGGVCIFLGQGWAGARDTHPARCY